MTLNSAMILRLAHRALNGKPADFASMASGKSILHPAETERIEPAIFSEDALERIIRLSPWCNWDKEMLTAKGGRVEHASTVAYTFEDVRIAGPLLYRGAAKSRHGFGPETLTLGNGVEFQEIDAAHILTNWPASEFFGQYLLDNFPLELIPTLEGERISTVTRPYPHAESYRSLLGLNKPKKVTYGRIKKLTIYRDFSQNSYKSKRYQILRTRLRDKLAPLDRKLTGVYIRRGAAGERRMLTNEPEIEARLASLGFDIVVPDQLTASEIAQRTLDAPIVVGVEGSHLSHAIFSVAEEGTFLVLQPPDRFAMAYKEFTDSMDMRFAFIVGAQTEDGFAIDVDELERMIDQLG